ncbi:MAG: hypothetical protein KME07_18105 [Pegethrix bostrychoides GSE-TBD4-15B]|uniref:Sulfatase-modifying factor enzyme-like domain-containing protein n=1 Tax=Pegethrix bostrychoides GSE-TBD4-15B TaxID=2839662 RepID=A0A951PD37_9CYAN|nr:hypothetical protein [Pegethrix bostrychoides GSE-TBD4-15B]
MPSEQAFYVLRGGSWGDDPRDCRSASRINTDSGSRDNLDGFRVVCSASRLS